MTKENDLKAVLLILFYVVVGAFILTLLPIIMPLLIVSSVVSGVIFVVFLIITAIKEK